MSASRYRPLPAGLYQAAGSKSDYPSACSQRMTGIVNCAPSAIVVGQRLVMVLSFVKKRTPSIP